MTNRSRRRAAVSALCVPLALLSVSVGCKVSKETLAKASEIQLKAIDALQSNIEQHGTNVEQLKQRLKAVTPKARNANLSNIEARLGECQAGTDDYGAAYGKISTEIESQRKTSAGLKGASMGKDEMDKEQKVFAGLQKKVDAAITELEAKFQKADNCVRSVERGVANIQQGLDEAGADSDGE